jgi:hypothetical protein
VLINIIFKDVVQMEKDIKLEIIHVIGRIIAGSLVLVIGKYFLHIWGG